MSEDRISQLEAMVRALRVVGPQPPHAPEPAECDEGAAAAPPELPAIRLHRRLAKVIKRSQKENWSVGQPSDLIIATAGEWVEIREYRRRLAEEERMARELAERKAMKRHGTLRKKKS